MALCTLRFIAMCQTTTFSAFSGRLSALIASDAKHHRFVAMQNLVGLRHFGHVIGGRHACMGQARFGIDADVGLHAEEPVLALLRLTHFRISFLVAVLGRRWCCN